MKLKVGALQAEERHVEGFRALSHLTRLKIFFYLVRKGEEGDSVGNILAALEVAGPTLSHHLDILFYSVRREMVSELVRLLTACC
ncbi:MAG: helix-turn-helix transcriptional regulator [Candidatus Rokubacteria bacterium]|nr:helix-turn-helix transcriptional regulator [Candidatus Rokubacteria bacterium]